MKLYLVTSVFLMMHSFSVYAACSFDTPAQCTTESECKFQKLTWANGICTDGSTPIPTTVNLAITPPTNGEIKCGDNADQTCPTKPTKDTPVKLTAKPSAGYQFKNWDSNSACAGQTTSICSLTMSTDKTVSVVFEIIPVCSPTTLSACTLDNCATLGNGVWNAVTNVCEVKTTPVCSSTTLSACTQDNCTTLGNGVWNTTTNVCDAKTIPVCSSTTLSACTQSDCATLGNGVWNTTTNACEFKTTPVCSSTTLSACTQDNCATLGNGVWNTTTNVCDAKTIPVCSSTTLSACTQSDCATLGNGVWNTATNVCGAKTIPVCNSTTLSACTQSDCATLGNGVWNTATNVCGAKTIPVCNSTTLSACTQSDCATLGNGVWNTAAQIPSCVVKPDLEPLEALAINKAGALETPKALFFGGARKGTSVSQTFSQGETISIDGVVFPETAHLNQLVDVIVLGRHVPALSAGQTVDDCNPQTGDYYINVKNGSYRDNYCSLDIISTKDVIQQHGNALFEELCNSASKTWNPEGKTCGGELLANALQSSWLNEAYCKRIKGSWNTSSLTCNVCNSSLENTLDKDLIRRSISVQTYWNRWSGKLNDLKPLASGFLSERTELTGLYMDTLNYTGHVCINFGYRLENGTIVFNGNPIKYHVSQ